MNIDTLLEKWDSAKKEKSVLEKDCERYKDAIERYMNKKDKDTVHGNYYTVTRRSNTRRQISKKNMPVDIWDKYANRVTYMSYHLKNNK